MCLNSKFRWMRCIIIEDEPQARELMELYVSKLPQLECLASFSNAIDALDGAEMDSVDLIFLDIEMPGINGVQFFKSLQHPPLVIFTTAYPEFALDGFELSAVDYLLKPFSFDRFLQAVNKAQVRLPKKVGFADKAFFQFKANKRTYRVSKQSIVALEAEGDYTRLFLKDEKHPVHGSINSILSELEGSLLRVHRSHAVNLDYLDFAEGNFLSILGREVPIGASYKDKMKEWLQ